MMTAGNQPVWKFPRRMLRDLTALTLLSWAGFVAVIAAIITGIAIFDTVDESIWDTASRFTLWYVAFIGGYLTYTMLPLYVTHGQTRREFAAQVAVFIPSFSAIGALLNTLGFVLERGLYSIADWPQEVSSNQLYSSPTELPLIFLAFFLLYLVWTSAGALIGAGLYRSERSGTEMTVAVALVLTLVPTATAGIVSGDSLGPLRTAFEFFMEQPGDIPAAVSIVVALVSFLLILALTWSFVREVPIRSRSS